MVRSLFAMDHPSDNLSSLKISYAPAIFFTTILTGVSSYKLLKWRGEKWIFIACRFAAGVFLGTAMIECLSESDIVFHVLGFRYPVAFLFACAGYLVAMLVECVLATVVQMFIQGRFFNEFLGNLKLIKSWYAISPVGISESETKDCYDIGYYRNRILSKVTQVGDGLFLVFILSVFSMAGGDRIGSAVTETDAWKIFLIAMFKNIIYIISLISLLLKFSTSIPITAGIDLNVIHIFSIPFLMMFSLWGPIGVVLTLLPNNDSTVANESVLVSILNNKTVNEWVDGTLMGYFSGVLVYLVAHHLLVDGHETNGSVRGTRFGKFLAMVFGVALIAFVNMEY